MLLVDDLADSGITLRAVVDRLRGMPSISELRSAVIWTKGVSSYTPDYYVELLPTSPWIHQPFEEYDDLRPAGLAQEVRRSESGLAKTKGRQSRPASPLYRLGAQEGTRTPTELPAST